MEQHIATFINNYCASLTVSMTIMSIRVQPTPITEFTSDTIPIVDEKTQQKFEKIAIRRLVRKLDCRLIPFMFLLEAGSYLNRATLDKYL
jgi:hypothetical protein